MIPRKIHYCWFGHSEMPDRAKKCIESWKKYLPDYELILWNEENFDINTNQYVKEAYESKKYAFVSDYVRIHALYYHGGIYLDTDVEVLNSLDNFLVHRAFIGCESGAAVGTGTILGAGTIASEEKHPWIEKILKSYDKKRFTLSNEQLNTEPNSHLITKITIKNYGWIPKDSYQALKDDLIVYPIEFFCANDWLTKEVKVTANTFTIHHFLGSWLSKSAKFDHKLLKFKRKIKKILGPNLTQVIVKYKKK